MKRCGSYCVALVTVSLLLPTVVIGGVLTSSDSTQPRGTVFDPATPATVEDGFWAPARFAGNISQEEGGRDFYQDWAGSMMANAARDPAFYATLSVANHDFISYLKSLSDADLAATLVTLELNNDIARDATGNFQCLSAECNAAGSPEDILPVTADLCPRCHTPAGWLEAHSEPATSKFDFLKGQFWGANFLEEPTGDGDPSFNINHESEAEMEGVQCTTCHRQTDNTKRISRHDGSSMPSGNGGFIVDVKTPFDPFTGPAGIPKPNDFQLTSEFCGTCHDVTNPILKTKTQVNGVNTADMNHPIERTFTEWYWSGYRGNTRCQDCHEPMKFLGAQTWMLYPVMDQLWGDVDQKWLDRGMANVNPSRANALRAAATRNADFMGSEAATVEFDNSPLVASPGQEITINVKVTNLTGHKLPTGFAEGRQMWLHFKVIDDDGTVVYEDGILNNQGCLVRTNNTKVYEQRIEAVGFNFLDNDHHGPCDAPANAEPEFHFVLMNKTVKDNRIPPMGFNKAAYQADGAFIIPEDLYSNGEHWDITPYTFSVPDTAKKKLQVTATLYYQTFSRDYIEFLKAKDSEFTQDNGGRARNLPAHFTNANPGIKTWGEALYKLWEDANMGPPVQMGQLDYKINLQ